ncbi:hypothetical protein R6Q57_021428 [Mikania cordata]
MNYQALGSQTVPYETTFLSSEQAHSVPKVSESDAYDWSDQVQELEMTLSHALMAKVADMHNEGREPTRLDYSEVKPPFNHTYSIMPKINKSVDDLLLKSDRSYEFTTSSNKPVSLTLDPILSDLNHSDDFEVCAEGLSVSGQSKEEEKRSARRRTNCSVSSNKSQFSIPKVRFVGKFETITVKLNEMIKNFRTKFVKTDLDIQSNCVLKSNAFPLTEKWEQADQSKQA